MTQRSRLIDMISSIPENKIHPVYDQIYPILKNNLTDDDKPITIACCPHCGSVSIKKNGTYNDKQRFLCKDCHKSFSMNTNTFLFHNRIPEEKWLQFIDYEMSGMALRHEAHFLGLSIHTCFRMRHKLYAAVSELAKTVKVTDKVQLDSAYRKINLKGTRPENMPRYSKKRGNGSAYSGISHHKVCIVSAIDSKDNMFLNIVMEYLLRPSSNK